MGGAAENLERRVREMKEIWDFKLNSRSRAAAPLTRAAARNPGFLFVYARAPRREIPVPRREFKIFRSSLCGETRRETFRPRRGRLGEGHNFNLKFEKLTNVIGA